LPGRQERNRRGGTENLPGIAGFAAACELASAGQGEALAHMEALRRRLEQCLLLALPAVHLYGREAARLPNTVCLRFGALPSEQVLGKLERAGIVASSGSACASGGTQPSHVLLAMGESVPHAKAGVRFSLGRDTTAADIERAIDAAVHVIGPLLTQAGEPAALAS